MSSLTPLFFWEFLCLDSINSNDLQKFENVFGTGLLKRFSRAINFLKYPNLAEMPKDLKNFVVIFDPYEKKEIEKAFRRLEKEAKKGLAYDIFNLALAHEYGLNDEQDFAEVKRLYLEAERAGHEQARVNYERLNAIPQQANPASKTATGSKKVTTTQQKNATTAAEGDNKNIPPNVQSTARSNNNNSRPTVIQNILKQPAKTKPAEESKKHGLSNAEHTEVQPKKPKLAPVIHDAPNPETVKTVLREFHPHIHPQSLNYKNIKFSEKNMQPVVPNKNYEPAVSSTAQLQSKSTALTENAKKEIGRWGEEYIYLALLQHYKEKMEKKYGTYNIKEMEKGFELSNEKNSIKVVWHNKGMDTSKDSGEDRDITIIKNGNNISKEKYIEVKTITASSDHTADFSKNEILKMLTCYQSGTKYRILRVYNAGTEDVKAMKITDPFKLIS